MAYEEEIRLKEEIDSRNFFTSAQAATRAAAAGSNETEDDNSSSNSNRNEHKDSDHATIISTSDSNATSPEEHHAAVSAALANLRGSSSSSSRYYTRLNHGGSSSSNHNSNNHNNSLRINTNISSQGRSFSFRDGMEHPLVPGTPSSNINFSNYNTNNVSNQSIGPRTPAASSPEPGSSFIPLTPPITIDHRLRNLSPPPPPGSQSVYGRHTNRRQTVSTMGMEPLPPPSSSDTLTHSRGISSPPPPPPPTSRRDVPIRPPHPLAFISTSATNPTSTSSSSLPPNLYPGSHNELSNSFRSGRYVPHVVTISLDTDPFPENLDIKPGRGKAYGAVAKGYRPRLGQLLEACPLDVNKASAVTCVKFSPSTDFCLIGYGVREPATDVGNNGNNANFHPVTAVYRIRGGMTHVSTMLSGDDDVNIARFHPDSGHSFVYGTKQGRVRVLSKRPWNFYDL
jgi:hypothetical protein